LKLEDQVCSLDLAKRLKELGVKQESLVYWWDGYQGYGYDAEKKWGPRPIERTEVSFQAPDRSLFWDKNSSAFTVAELGEILKPWTPPFWNEHEKLWTTWARVGISPDAIEISLAESSEAAARASMLIQLIKKGLLKP
jgi:hypothetical protein